MVSKKINKISNQVDAFYLLIKKAVPLDEVIFTPYSDYYNPDDPDFISPRKSKKGEMDLPSIQEFKSHFKNTNIKYRIIYLKNSFGLSSGFPISIDRYKNKIQKSINSSYERHSKETLEEGKYLLNNADKIFNPEAINVIASKYESTDFTGPKGVDHDLGHAILDEHEFDLKSEDMLKAIQKDYKIITENSFGEKVEYDFLNYSGNMKSTRHLAFVLLSSIIAINNPIPGSISEMNIKNKDLSDFFADLMIIYNLKGESLKDVNLTGIVIYTDSILSKFALEPSEKLNVKMEPVNINIPNITKELKILFSNLEEEIRNKLASFVGNVVALWS